MFHIFHIFSLHIVIYMLYIQRNNHRTFPRANLDLNLVGSAGELAVEELVIPLPESLLVQVAARQHSR